jgi:PAS domain S-box-containing protein
MAKSVAGKGLKTKKRPAYPSLSRQCLGLGLVALTITSLELAARVAPGAIKDPGASLWLVVLMVTYLAGLRAGMIGSAMSVLYLAYVFSKPGELFRYDHAMAQKMWGEVVLFPLFTWIVGYIQNRLRNAAVREHDARQSADQEAAGRRETEQVLKSSENLWRMVFDATFDGIIATRPDGVITLWNAGAEQIFGFSREQTLGRPFSTLMATEERTTEPEKGYAHSESVLLHRNGETVYLSINTYPIRDGEGNLTGYAKVARDVTEKKQAEDRLQAQLSRLNLLRQITQAIGERQDLRSIFQVVIGTLEEHLPIDLCFVCLYSAADDVLTVSSVGLNGIGLAERLSMTEGSQIPIDQNGLSQCVKGGLVYEPDISEVQFPFPMRLAAEGLKSFVAAPLLVESQVFGVLIASRREPDGFTSSDCEFLKNLSAHVALAAHQADLYGALQHAYNDLRQTQQAVMQQERLRALGQMASGIAHDINNAISPVALYTEALLETEPNLSDRARGYLEITARAIDDVAATVARMREFYREREPQAKLAQMDINRLVHEVVNLTRARWSDMPLQQGIVIRMGEDLQNDLLPVLGIENEVREVLTNLILNAVDAMPEGGELTIRTASFVSSGQSDQLTPLQKVQVELIDSGIGMDEDTRRRCLEPFFTTKGERGTGLGLAMVYGVLQRHGADIEIESEIGKGTTMRMSFATATEEPDAVGTDQHAPPVTATRILVVDDDALLLRSLRDILEHDGHHVVTAGGGQAGVDAFAQSVSEGYPFPVVITDLGMPNVDGRKVAAAVKAASSSTLVILLTGWGQRLVAEGNVPPHVDHVLSKPPKLRDLRQVLHQEQAEAA